MAKKTKHQTDVGAALEKAADEAAKKVAKDPKSAEHIMKKATQDAAKDILTTQAAASAATGMAKVALMEKLKAKIHALGEFLSDSWKTFLGWLKSGLKVAKEVGVVLYNDAVLFLRGIAKLFATVFDYVGEKLNLAYLKDLKAS